jgi:hypothetical protein
VRGSTWPVVMMLVLAAGCGGRTVLGGPPDRGGPRDLGPPDLPLREAGPWWPDRGVPPLVDWGPVPDKALPCPMSIGDVCTPSGGCCGGLSCVGLSTGIWVCTQSCKPDDPATPLVNEDDCPNMVEHICATIDYPGTSSYCLRKCAPTAGIATCPPGIACHPRSAVMSSYTQTAVCAFPACASSQDCPVYRSEPCTAGGAECSGLSASTFCALEPGASDGTCALPGICDPISGLCTPHAHGKSGAKVGDPCQDDRDCAGNMRCERESGAGIAIHARNGYCVIEGCTFASTLITSACPPGSTCNHLYPGGECFKTCSLTTAADCRGLAADKHGDYDCYAWNNLSASGLPLADEPTCEPADSYPCTFWGSSSLDCEALGLIPNNPTQMACRDRVTGAALPAHSPGGFCLDTTASGN